ncbi:MAG: hypothetical protein M3R36_03010 [Bacteroidota bacterium]|nr:hypothetical protein [Bacteroidota bacterium]
MGVGGIIGGWSFYCLNGKLKYYYNFLGVENYAIESTKPLLSGKHQVRMEFKYEVGGLWKRRRCKALS